MMQHFFLQVVQQPGVDAVYGETHDVEERAVDTVDADVTDPLLDTVCTGFVKRFETVDVIGNLFVRQCFEVYCTDIL